MADFSILRMMDSSAKTAEEAHRKTLKHLNYITRSSATQQDLIYCDKVNLANMTEDFGYFLKVCGDTGRPLKHTVISFGYNDQPLTWQRYFEVTKAVAKYYAKDYQIVAAVHSNIPSRPHAHILIDCYNVSTGKKFSEGLNELENFKDYVDSVLSEFNIPLLKRKERIMKKVKGEVVPIVETYSSDEQGGEWYEEIPTSFAPVVPPLLVPPYTYPGMLRAPYGNYQAYPQIIINNYYYIMPPPVSGKQDEFGQNRNFANTKSASCDKCGKPLSKREKAFCQEKGLMPLCYSCQHSQT